MPPMDKRSVQKVIAYRKKGLGVREIARIMGKNPTQIMRWLKYSVDSYTQPSVDNKK